MYITVVCLSKGQFKQEFAISKFDGNNFGESRGLGGKGIKGIGGGRGSGDLSLLGNIQVGSFGLSGEGVGEVKGGSSSGG